MSRQIAGLLSAQQLAGRPRCIPPNRARKGSKRYGLAFERSVAERTGGRHGTWFQFLDANGPGYCQTDVILGLDGQAIILECKLTEVEDARRQLQGLYLPVVERALARPVRGIVVVRHLTRESDLSRVVTSMGQALKLASASFFPTLHWLGRGPI